MRRPSTYRARQLRRDMSPPERLLWRHLRLRPDGFKFRRQHPIGAYVVDFYCSEARLAVEIDGWAHETGERVDRDRRREAALRSLGLAIVRIPAADVMRDVVGAVSAILARARGPLHQASPGPPPRPGEE
ncbi:MAG: endonuclease domain-containing protein [Allosphingosinicella sp.]|uniref:endonuclease domain-containing protein n=1 Tax=Allosphingosinicella sp. TaxID=2823234 RepID=UPI003945143A